MPQNRLKRPKAARSGRKRVPTLPKLKAQAWKLLSEVIRKEAVSSRGLNRFGLLACYTCGAAHQWDDGIQAGHAIPGRTGSVLLDEEIIRPQCFACNIPNHGRYEVFTTKLIWEKAASSPAGLIDAMRWWEAKLQSSRQVKKWDRTELEAKISEYRGRLQALT